MTNDTGGGPLDSCPRIALLTPYTGGNLGDAAIQDAMITNLRVRLPAAQFSGLTLNCANFVVLHGDDAFPLSENNQPSYGIFGARSGRETATARVSSGSTSDRRADWANGAKRLLRKIPLVNRCARWVRDWARPISREIQHSRDGYRFLRAQDLLIVSGGGQLDDTWGGAWGHPFALFKWAVLARIARIPYAIASVGASGTNSRLSQVLLSAVLRMASYRSYRDENSKNTATALLRRASSDPVVPDLAFSLPPSEYPPPAGIRVRSQGRTIVAISPIAYARPGIWPLQDSALYTRYLQQMAAAISQLLEREYFLVIVCSALADKVVIDEIFDRVDPESKKRLASQSYIPVTETWKDLVASLQDVDFLIASRLHSAILGFASEVPTIAISFDPKVDWVMEDLGQTEYLLQIRNFTANDVIEVLNRIALARKAVVDQIVGYRREALSACEQQYDALARLAMAVGSSSA
jgi:polysaccharide pyruvyl transferase WcaK-like protein